MPWRGPTEPGEFPTLGYLAGEWIEAHVVIPDGDLQGEPYKLTEEMWRFLVRYYRLNPLRLTRTGRAVFRYRGAQLMRSQKWGKGPFSAAIGLAEALGPVVPDGWDADGEPVGRPWPTPLIQVTAVSEDQADNVYGALINEVRYGPLVETVNAGETGVNLPGGGRIDPVTASARSRLGQRVTFVIQDEPHLWVTANSMVTLANNQRRGLAGMSGRWLETTNAFDPAERSVAQTTYEGKARDVLLDHRHPRRRIDFGAREELLDELAYIYGDSWWVDLERIADEMQDPGTTESDGRRYFLSEIVAGTDTFVDTIMWDAKARPDEVLKPREPVALGFDGSKTDDATSIVACRISDGHVFHIQTWERPKDHEGKWRVPSAEVDRVLKATFEAYRVIYLYADPWKWQDYLDAWSALFPKRVVEFPTNVETRMDKAIERFRTAFTSGEITQDGTSTLRRHVTATVISKGKRKTPRDDSDGTPGFYLRMAKRNTKVKIDTAVAMVLAYEARGQAIEDGALKAAIDPLKTIY